MTGDDFLYCLDADAATLKFLSQALLKELNAEAIEELAAQQWPSDTGNDHLDLGYRYLRRYFHFSGTDRRTQLAVEYARVFLAAGVQSKDVRTAVPYESVFTSAEREMMGASRDDVVRIYAEDGFVVDPALHEPEDHLSFELEYLQSMAGRTLEALEANDEPAFHKLVKRQIDFLDNHLLNWVPDLLEVVQEYAKNAFYLGIAYVVLGTCEQYRDLLADVREHGLETDPTQEALDDVMGAYREEKRAIARAEDASRAAEQAAAAQGFSVSAQDAHLPVDENGAVMATEGIWADGIGKAGASEERDGGAQSDAARASASEAQDANESEEEEPKRTYPVARPPHKKPASWK